MANTRVPGAQVSHRDDETPVVIPVKPKLQKRFHEAIVFLATLVASCARNGMSKALDLSSYGSKSPENTFHCFVNKISQLCDSRPGGDTVTAFAVLDFPDCIQYRFGSNRRAVDELCQARHFIAWVLGTLRDARKHQPQKLQSLLLRESLTFNKTRVKVYLNSLRKHSITCAGECRADPSSECKIVLKGLEELQKLLLFSENSDLGGNSYYKSCEALILAVYGLYSSEFGAIIGQKAGEDKMNERSSWRELRHAAGRLLSYLRAVQTLIWTGHQWPELFEKFEVKYVESSTPAPNPLPGKRATRINAQDVVGRMTSGPDAGKMAIYKAQAEEWQRKFDLDNKLRERAESLKPIVHAEVLVLRSLEEDVGTHISRFYNGYKYIGCSKPTCRLCHYYFEIHPSGVQVQPTHWNVYSNWRVPDVYETGGREAVKGREDLMNKMVMSIRSDAFRTLGEKLSDGRPHDSLTDPSYQKFTISAQESNIPGDLTTAFEELDIGSSSGNDDGFTGNAPSSTTISGITSVDSEPEDNEDGGASL